MTKVTGPLKKPSLFFGYFLFGYLLLGYFLCGYFLCGYLLCGYFLFGYLLFGYFLCGYLLCGYLLCGYLLLCLRLRHPVTPFVYEKFVFCIPLYNVIGVTIFSEL